MSAKAFVDLLAERQIVPAGTIEQLRKQVAASAKSIPAAAVAKALLDKQLLTAHQAQSLLDAAGAAAPAPTPAKPAAPAKPAVAPSPALADEFGLAPLEEDKPAAKKEPPKKEIPKKETPPQPAAPAANKPPPKPVREKPATAPAAASTDDALFGGGSDDLFGSGALGSDLGGGGFDANDPLSGVDPLSGAGAAPTLQSAAAKKSSSAKPWKLWGAIAGSLLFLGAVAGIAATRDNGDGAWTKLQETIKQSPADTEAALNGFLASYPLHAQAGQAQVLLAQLRLKELEKRSGSIRDNAKALAALVEPLVTEPEVTIVQPQLAKQIPETIRALLTSAAGMDAKNLAGRTELAEIAKQLWTLGNDPRVIPHESRPWRSWDEYQETIAQLLRDAKRAEYLKELEPALSSSDAAALKAKLLESLTQYPELAEAPEWQAAANRAGL